MTDETEAAADETTFDAESSFDAGPAADVGPALDVEPEAATLSFNVAPEEAGARLDAYLAARVPHVSRTRLKQAVADGDVLVDGRAAKPSYKLRGGEQIELEAPAPPAADFRPEDIPLDIVYEDDAVIVVNKPAGMVVHPAAGVHSGTLANALAHRLRIADCGLRIQSQSRSSIRGERPAPSVNASSRLPLLRAFAPLSEK
jgi:23S rRNA pseudouridine1911/1915/1917 synthase